MGDLYSFHVTNRPTDTHVYVYNTSDPTKRNAYLHMYFVQ